MAQEYRTEEKGFNRRDFIKLGAAASMGAVLAGTSLTGCAGMRQFIPAPAEPLVTPPKEVIRIGFVGIGSQGGVHVNNLLRIEGVQLTAVCDVRPERVEWAQKRAEESSQPRPSGYARGDLDFIRMCQQEDLDLVYTATPWRWHVPVCVAAMRNGKHAATEVPAAITLEECWELIETSEKTKRHCVMMENCNYDRTELMVLNMVRQGLFGELLHAECGYLHDLRWFKLTPNVYYQNWRLAHSVRRNGDLYPTHGLAPIAQCVNINRGNQFDHLVSMSCKSRGLNLYAAEKLGPDHKWAAQKYALGDVVNSLIRTKQGQTILVTHDTNNPRPYSRKILLQGTRGIIRKYPQQMIHIEGRTQPHEWEDLSTYYEEFEHPLWMQMQTQAQDGGHGGMDFIEDYRLIKCLRQGLPLDMDVYDAAALSAVSALSEKSIAQKSRSIDFPDFTRGRWKTNTPLGIVEA